jgi:hypothetical protein
MKQNQFHTSLTLRTCFLNINLNIIFPYHFHSSKWFPHKSFLFFLMTFHLIYTVNSLILLFCQYWVICVNYTAFHYVMSPQLLMYFNPHRCRCNLITLFSNTWNLNSSIIKKGEKKVTTMQMNWIFFLHIYFFSVNFYWKTSILRHI